MTVENLKFGCPMWSHEQWNKRWFAHYADKSNSLNLYSDMFNSVEGNTSFYSLPGETSLRQWSASVPDNFAFTFKFPKTVSHDVRFGSNQFELDECLTRFNTIRKQIGCLMLQLPASFGPDSLSLLDQFLAELPDQFTYAVEVRHLGFFDKGTNEKAFNRVLIKHKANRVMMDTRGLFSVPSNGDALLEDVQSKKPRVPTNVVATGTSPVIRYVGHPEIAENTSFLLPWVHKLVAWLEDGMTPYLFFHMPDNAKAPWLAEFFFDLCRSHYPDLAWPDVRLPHYEGSQADFLGDL